MFSSKKQTQRTCKNRKCKHTWFVPYELRNLTIQRVPHAFPRIDVRLSLRDTARATKIISENQLASTLVRCPQCGSSSYTDSTVRL